MLTTPSEWLKTQVEHSFLGQYPVYALPNGIDTDAFAPCADEAFLRNAAHYYGLDEAEGRYLVLSVAARGSPARGWKTCWNWRKSWARNTAWRRWGWTNIRFVPCRNIPCWGFPARAT